MSGLARLSLMLLIRALSVDLPDLEEGSAVNHASTGVTAMVVLTAFDANDQTLTLRYKVMNRSDHDIWVCEGVDIAGKLDGANSEVYMNPDARTLVIAKRVEAPLQVMYVRPPDIEGRYVRLRPGQERIWSLSLGVPVNRYTLFTSGGPHVDYATRLLLRIGVFEKDLSKEQDIEEVLVPYRWLAPISGDERYMEITIDGVLIELVQLIKGIRPPVGALPGRLKP